MTTSPRTTHILAAVFAGVLATAGLAGVGTAHAGRGGSAAQIRDAIASGSADAIIAEVERAEMLICPACVEPLMELLESDRYELREVAAWWFARRPVLKSQLSAQAVTALAGTDTVAARNAADLLGAFGHPQAVPALVTAATNRGLGAEARAAAVRALGILGNRGATPGLVTALADPDATVRWAAVDAWLAIRGQRGAAPVVARLTDGDATVRARAAAVVGSLHEPTARAALEGALAGDASPEVRRNAAWALGELGDSAARPALTAALTDASGLVRRTAQAALARL